MGQWSSVLELSVIKTEVSLDSDDPANQDVQLQQYGERIEKLSQQDTLGQFCMDAGFLNVVEIGQYFMTKDTRDISQFHAVDCREYTLQREDEASQPQGWIQGIPKLDTYWKLQPVIFLVNMEIRIMFFAQGQYSLLGTISHGSNKFVMDLNSNETEIPEDQFEDQALQLDAKDFVCRSKTKSKTTKKRTCRLFTRIVLIGRKNLIDIGTKEIFFSDCDVSKKVLYLLRFSQKVRREEDGAVHFRVSTTLFPIV